MFQAYEGHDGRKTDCLFEENISLAKEKGRSGELEKKNLDKKNRPVLPGCIHVLESLFKKFLVF